MPTSHVLGAEGSYPLLVFLWIFPLLGALVLWAFGPQLRSMGGPIGAAAVGVSFCAALLSWGSATAVDPSGVAGGHQTLVTWLPGFEIGILWDRLTLVWTLIITGVGFLIHVYSIGYMEGDRAFARFFAYLNFFIFAMLTLVLADDFVMLLVGWGLVGLASYLLIGFWFDRPTAVAAARKAFVINVFGDIGILAAIFVIFAHVGSITYGDTFAAVSRGGVFDDGTLFLACLLLFVGAAAKSAQVPLHTWLPDAMEGPTPVSALIHAATMVTAGVYLVARCAPMWSASPDARMLVGVVGGITAILGAILGCGQWDIKRILAYSTMSQIGYMIMGVGVGAFAPGVLHFFTHAFFKAMLFMGAGLIIHELANEQDTRKMGGLAKRMPFTFWAMLVGVLAICGFPGFSGFFSKDAIVYETLVLGYPALYAIGALTAGITAYYMSRLMFLTFGGTYRGDVDPSRLGIRHPELMGTTAGGAQVSPPHDEAHTPHEHHGSSPLMTVPVAILMIPATFAGWLYFGGASSPWTHFFDPVFHPGAEPSTQPILNEATSTVLVLVLVAVGFGIAYLRYGTKPAVADDVERLREESVRMPALLTNAFYFDAAIDAIFVRPSQAFGSAFERFVDPVVIDGAVREASFSAGWLGHLFRSFQTGLVRGYALILVLGVTCFVTYYALHGAR